MTDHVMAELKNATDASAEADDFAAEIRARRQAEYERKCYEATPEGHVVTALEAAIREGRKSARVPQWAAHAMRERLEEAGYSLQPAAPSKSDRVPSVYITFHNRKFDAG